MHQQTVNQGLPVHGELTESTAATTRVPLREQEDNSAKSLSSTEYLVLAMVAIHAAAAGEVVLFFDEDDAGTPSADAGSVIWRGTVSAGESIVLNWATLLNGRRGPAGHGVFLTAPGSGDTNVVVDALVRKRLSKSTAAGTPTHDPS